MSVKFTEELCVITMKNDATFEKELALHFKIDTTIWWISTRAFEYLKNLQFNGLLLTKVYNAWGKKVQKNYVWWHRNWRKIWRKLSCAFQNDMMILTNIQWLKAIILRGDFILESKTAQPNQIKNSKQLDRPDAVRKLYFAFEIKE